MNGTHSGFVETNTGTIQNSYTTAAVKGDKNAGFCSRNSGTIRWCYADGKVPAKKSYAFCPEQSRVRNCFYITKDKDDKSPLARVRESLTPETLIKDEWDLTGIFEDKTGAPVFRRELFAPDKGDESASWRRISSAADLQDFAEGINSGDANYQGGNFLLTCDIDLKGADWTPIGKDELTPFSGRFDGGGHSISGFHIKNKSLEYSGFFGVCTSAEISHLVVDGKIDGGKLVGGFAAMNDKSIISRCGAAVSIGGGDKIGAFIGKNTGSIDCCFVTGEFRGGFPLLLLLVPILILILILLFLFLRQPAANNGAATVYAPVAPDPNVEPADSIAAQAESFSADNVVSLTFGKTISAASGTGLATGRIENPVSGANQYVVASLQITDETLVEAIGRTGRTAEEQAEYDADPNYDPSLCRVTVAKTGAISPGEKIEKIQLSALPDGTVLPAGKYPAILYFEFYSTETNGKAAVNSQSAVWLEIGQ